MGSNCSKCSKYPTDVCLHAEMLRVYTCYTTEITNHCYTAKITLYSLVGDCRTPVSQHCALARVGHYQFGELDVLTLHLIDSSEANIEYRFMYKGSTADESLPACKLTSRKILCRSLKPLMSWRHLMIVNLDILTDMYLKVYRLKYKPNVINCTQQVPLLSFYVSKTNHSDWWNTVCPWTGNNASYRFKCIVKT